MLNPEFTEMLRLTDATVFDGLPEALTATAPPCASITAKPPEPI